MLMPFRDSSTPLRSGRNDMIAETLHKPYQPTGCDVNFCK